MTGAPGQMHALSPNPILAAMPVLRYSKITSATAGLILEEAGRQGRDVDTVLAACALKSLPSATTAAAHRPEHSTPIPPN
jgi:hypothetical protein